MLLHVNLVAIATTFFVSRQYPGNLQVGDNAHRCALRNADLVGDISHASAGVLGKADQGMRMVTQEVPRG
jgi:hypothetical protein